MFRAAREIRNIKSIKIYDTQEKNIRRKKNSHSIKKCVKIRTFQCYNH